MSLSAALALALSTALAAAALDRRHTTRRLADRDTRSYNTGYLDALSDVRSGHLAYPEEQ